VAVQSELAFIAEGTAVELYRSLGFTDVDLQEQALTLRL
jgi:hypothetical protein